MRSLVLLLTLLISMTCSALATKMLDRPDDHYALFLWGNFKEAGLASNPAAIVEAKDPLRSFQIIFRLIRKTDPDLRSSGLEMLDHMIDDYEPAGRDGDIVRWQYGHDYEAVKAPWHSAMDQLMAPVVLWSAYELTGRERYKRIALANLHAALKTPPEGGSLWQTSEGCWFSEYAWTSMTIKDEMFVLNGHLFALNSLALMRATIKSDEIETAYKCAKRATISMQTKFVRKDGSWTWYQIYPNQVINPPHYALIDIALFQSIAKVTGESEYLLPADIRLQHFKEQYPLFYTSNGTRREIVMTTAGAPHVYLSDIYAPVVTCGDVSKMDDARFFVMSVAEQPSHCEVKIDTGGFVLPLFRQDILPVTPTVPTELPVIGNCSLDATCTSVTQVAIRPDTNPDYDEGRITLRIDRDINPSDILSIAMTSDSDAKVDIVLLDTKGNGASRSYLDIKGGKTDFIFLNRLGFQTQVGREIAEAIIRIYTTPGAAEFNVGVGSMYLARNAAEQRSVEATIYSADR